MNRCRPRPGRCWTLLLLIVLAGCEQRPADSDVHRGDTGSAGLRVQSLLSEAADAEPGTTGFARAEPDTAIVLPRDHGPHPTFRSEWWYLTLMLSDQRGREFGGQFTLFRQALTAQQPEGAANPWRTNQVYMAHLAVTDVAGKRHQSAERISRAHPALAGVQAAPFAAWLEDWRFASAGSTFLPLQLNAGDAGFSWALSMDSDKPIVLQGKSGYSAKGPDQGSHYYSLTRLNVQGTLTLSGTEIPVRGTGWLDREWSTSVLSAGQTGWDWFALQLADGRDLMVFNLRREDCSRDPFDHGIVVDAEGNARLLQAEDFELTPLRAWRGPARDVLEPVRPCIPSSTGDSAANDTARTAGPWPLEWRLRLAEETFVIRASILDQRMRTSVRYWEGLVEVFSESPRREVGRGYMELTGYE